tara:strand:- start:15 stop:743 length:729 start_codon:yes stop_codon:yes gene_type:complete
MKIPFEYCAEEYAAYRPDYPTELYDFVAARCSLESNSMIIDVGAGTGKGSAPLLERGFQVVAFDISEKMLDAGRRNGHRNLVCSVAEQIPLGESSANLILCAQSFHWFASTDTLAEFARVIKPTGYLALFWNTRAKEPDHQKEYERLIRKFNPEHVCGYRDIDWTPVLERDGFFRSVEQEKFKHTDRMTIESWKGLARSTSYIRCIGEEQLEQFERELEQVMKRESAIDIQYLTEVWLAEPV